MCRPLDAVKPPTGHSRCLAPGVSRCLASVAFAFAALGVTPASRAGPAIQAEAIDAPPALLEIVDLAGRQPDDAQRRLVAWLAQPHASDTTQSVLIDLAEIRIADAQDRATDVLTITQRFTQDAQGLGRPAWRAMAAHALASAYFQLNRFDDMRRALIDEGRFAGDSGDPDVQATALVNWTRYYLEEGDFASAARAIAQSNKLARGTAAHAELAYFDYVFARRIEDYNRAHQSAEKALAYFEQLSDQIGVADARLALAQAAFDRGNSSEAIALLPEVESDYQRMQDNLGVDYARSLLAVAQLDWAKRATPWRPSARQSMTWSTAMPPACWRKRG
jgi:tetratricopeptide (TPR) repeat protein